MREQRFSLPNIPVNDCHHICFLWLFGLSHTHRHAECHSADSFRSFSGFTTLKSADCKPALNKKQRSLACLRLGQQRGGGKGCLCVRGRLGGRWGLRVVAGGLPRRDLLLALRVGEMSRDSLGSLLLGPCLSLSLSCLFSWGSICRITVGLRFACISGQQVE